MMSASCRVLLVSPTINIGKMSLDLVRLLRLLMISHKVMFPILSVSASDTRHRASLNENILSCRTVGLCTSTIKMDAEEDTDLRLCFRIISPLKTYTLQN
ncbi:ADP-ribosylation factor GTPase-activating protein AGD2 [Prunus yedoensis var. nudiflora]|uniref:ADP-ribosylation factor GTPase-activating protein AGD2 n=1 Tax=Prunus yedoensis var. nudiflora TaxID=2094558 RepID=A0A314XVV3_PRUYE|nr:ADP-ribosylation factor GTPase-activating protein AGD2 [Prunus yedoensis var. nudiflora]